MRRHLRPNGRLVIHLFDPRLEYCLPGADAAPMARPAVHDPATGQDIAVTITTDTTIP